MSVAHEFLSRALKAAQHMNVCTLWACCTENFVAIIEMCETRMKILSIIMGAIKGKNFREKKIITFTKNVNLFLGSAAVHGVRPVCQTFFYENL